MLKYIQSLYYYPAEGINTTVNNYPAINSVKAMLIVMIIITHSLPESMTLYFMYLFHMPVFLGISGFLLKESAFKKGFSYYFNKIRKRLIIPWLIAFAVYLPFQLAKLNSTNPLELLLFPFYHLWYIPAYILGSIACYALYKFKIPVRGMLAATGLITITWYLYFRDIHLSVHDQPLYWLGEKRFYCYLFFFVLGYSFRNNLVAIRLTPIITLFITMSSFLLIALCIFRHMSDYFIVLPYLVFNVSLLVLLFLFIAHRPILQNRFWLYINSQSLGIYFYHPIILILIYESLGDPSKEHVSKLMGLIIGVITIGLSFMLTKAMSKWKFSNRYLLGNL